MFQKISMKFTSLFILSFLSLSAIAQHGYWQQRAEYTMDIDFNAENNQYSGNQELTYFNNSPDTLVAVYFHLYPNAFQPGSMMDVRSRSIEDPDSRVGSRIAALTPEEQGFIKVNSLEMNGNSLDYEVSGTILEVMLDKPILPGKKVKFEMDFLGQVPVQIRRSGRDNKEGVAYSMSQWYPKMAEYDRYGWHADPYISREFHGVWGDFNVNISIDSAYTLGGTGVLQNPKEVGHGYAQPGDKMKLPDGAKFLWKFKAENVHDFVWAADKNYIHDVAKADNGLTIHFLYKDEPDIYENWQKLQEYSVKLFNFASATFGQYPWSHYSIIQGGDGGMEYPMATLITGQRSLGSLVGVTVHEVMHSWYQGALATNEGYYPWMDEGFTEFAGSKVMSHLFNPDEDTRRGRFYDSYLNLVNSGKEEPMATRGDYFKTNYAYGAAAYGKGGVFVGQLGYIVGDDVLMRSLKRYFNTWKFKHPDPYDFIRIVEGESGMQLDWYISYMLSTTEKIDYAIKRVEARNNETIIALERVEQMPMPIDLNITYRDGYEEVINIPMTIMRGEKNAEDDTKFTVKDDWQWTNKTYSFSIARSIGEIEKIEIDPSQRMADVDRSNNTLILNPDTQTIISN
ncbi:M1 family metallopeptidase [Cryomorpha ignava]|uniref:M1 family metallopeptidase n=2 Tax=Cryomorpha ignava TaxID=101383 RepID=A0A7K3WUY9_9FLAO|nr:M1 family metallopeptidase [Cryomorpha ignava]